MRAAVLCVALCLASPLPASAQVTYLDSVSGVAANGHLAIALDIEGSRVVIGDAVGGVFIYHVDAADHLVRDVTVTPFTALDSGGFGSAVELDGDRLFVGAPNADGDSGAVYFFERQSDGTWSGIQRITEVTRIQGVLGTTLRSVGDLLAASAFYYDRDSLFMGRVFLFRRGTTNTYTQASATQAVLSRPACVQCQLFGYGMDFDGMRLAATDRSRETVYVWDVRETATNVTLGAPRSYARNTYFRSQAAWGDAIAFSSASLVVGGRTANVDGVAEAGVLQIVNETTGTLMLTHPSGVTHGTQDRFGNSVAASGDWAAAGTGGGPSGLGYVYVYHRSTSGVWTALPRLTSPDGAIGATVFGGAIAISGDLMMVGEQNSSRGGANVGRAHLFRLTPPPRGLGETCTLDTGCGSVHCVDGVCCNTACAGTCLSCLAASTGGTSGMCASVSAGTDPDAECSRSICSAGACNGLGACVAPPACDAGTLDAGVDAAQSVDASARDAFTPDAFAPDASAPDAARTDSGSRDATIRADVATTVPRLSVSCLCAAGTAARGPLGLAWSLLALAAMLRVRRRRGQPRWAALSNVSVSRSHRSSESRSESCFL